MCRKKWKSLRDTYLKEKRKEMDNKRSGSAAGSVKKWKYSQILGFLDPFVTPRETTSNMGGVEAQVMEYNHPRDQGEGEAEAGDTEIEPTDNEEADPRSPAASPVSPVPGASPPAAAPTGQQRRRGTRRPRDGTSEVEQTLLELLRCPPAPAPPPPLPPPPPPPLSADEHFLLSLLPFLQSMPPQTKEIVKFKMYKLAMENSTVVLNLEQLDPHSP
ncbi:unnamed protein product [Leuciscus chuanchicus]